MLLTSNIVNNAYPVLLQQYIQPATQVSSLKVSSLKVGVTGYRRGKRCVTPVIIPMQPVRSGKGWPSPRTLTLMIDS